IFLGLPDRAARSAILRVVLEGERLGGDVLIDRLAELTAGYSGSDLRQLCVAAAMRPESSAEAGEEAEPALGAVAAELAAVTAADEGVPEAVQVTEPGRTGPGSPGSSSSSSSSSSEGGRDSSMDGHHQENGTGAGASAGPRSEAASHSAASSSVAASLRLMPRLDSLLRQAERLASAPRSPKTDLRPIGMQDFEEALKEVGASVNPDSAVIQELNEWNAQYGTTGNKAGVQSKRLSYFT
ncbi:hypothetical protein ABPG77_009112, partial [Micractinium sp. CCAP 211/92]